MARTALIFGVSGQDGAYLARLLIEKGYAVHGVSRDAEMASFGALRALGVRDQIRTHSASLSDFRSVLQVISRTEPSEIYNLAGQSSVGLSFSLPVETLESIGTGTLNVLEAIRFVKADIRFYNAGSSECFGDVGAERATETTAFRPRSPYGVAKAAAYWQVANYRQAYGLFACSGILFNHESPLRPPRFVTRKVTRAVAEIARGRTEKLVLGDLSVRRDWGWAPEYVQAMWLMLQQSEPDDFIIATGTAHRLEDFVAAAFAAAGLDWREHVRVDESLFRPSDIAMSCGDPAHARAVLGWTAKTLMPDVARRMMLADLNGNSVDPDA